MTAEIGDHLFSQQANNLHLSWDINEAQLEWKLEAKIEVAVVGECQAWGIPTHFRGCAGYNEWMTFEWLGVEDAFQRQGFGRRLLSEQMMFHAKRGVKKVALWVTLDNMPARHLYQSMGFTYAPECWSFVKVLS
jgi:GNAT superfamily N-acetyltransferase